MAVLVNNIKLPVQDAWDDLAAICAGQLKVPKQAVAGARIMRLSLDARRKNDIHFIAVLLLEMEGSWQTKLLRSGDARVSLYLPMAEPELIPGTQPLNGRVVVVGLGPAGLFAASILAKHGYAPLVIERGQKVEQRMQAVSRFWHEGALDVESNVMFGEGGAGTFSDGKLTTRIKDPRADAVLNMLVAAGAPGEIAYQAKPHVGTDLLRAVVSHMRRDIERMGGEVRFGAKLTDIEEKNGVLHAVHIQHYGTSERIPCCACVLAMGQGARDTYQMLLRRGQVLQPKAFAVGVRIEHPQSLIDRSQFGALAGHPRLGAAEYRVSAKSGGRGVYSFCMCPGGHVIASSSDKEQVVVNGMSNHARNAPNANAAIVVQVTPDDFGHDPMDGIRFQETLEKRAFHAGGGDFAAPAQRLEDFLRERKTTAFGDVEPTYRPGVVPKRLDAVLPDFVAQGIRDGIRVFARQIKGFDLPDAVLTAVESRTSAPVRILRDETGQAVNAKGLYPVGEGAGYAGGIVSAAVDGMRAAERIIAQYSTKT